MLFEKNATVIFQGDSITDADRDRSNATSLGTGYAMLAAAWFSALYPDQQVRFINRGISGNRIGDLQKRWQSDCLDLQPTWVSILIGINDVWRRYDEHIVTTPEDYATSYRALLQQACTQNIRLIMCEPFVLPVPADRTTWHEDLDPKIHVVRQLAQEYGAIYVPFDGIFAQAATRREPAFWAEDGVHPTSAGHALMAQAWLRAVGAL